MWIDELEALGRGRIKVLVQAAREGRIPAMECAMEVCTCPLGRGHFEPRGAHSRWAPSVDRYPVAGVDGGEYITTNVRLAHASCNSAAGALVTVARRKASGWQSNWSPEARARQAEVARAIPPEDSARGRAIANARIRGPEERAQLRRNLAAWQRTPEAHAVFVAAGTKGMCTRYAIRRGKPCVCGHHANV